MVTNSSKDGRYHVIYVHNMIEVILYKQVVLPPVGWGEVE